MSFLFIYSLINYYTALKSLTLKSSLGGGSVAVQPGQPAKAPVCAQTPHGAGAPPACPALLSGQRQPAITGLGSRRRLPALAACSKPRLKP